MIVQVSNADDWQPMDFISYLGLAPGAIKAIRSAIRGSVSVDPSKLAFPADWRGVSTVVITNNKDRPLFDVWLAAWPESEVHGDQVPLALEKHGNELLGPDAVVADHFIVSTGLLGVYALVGGKPLMLVRISALNPRQTARMSFRATQTPLTAKLDVIGLAKSPSATDFLEKDGEVAVLFTPPFDMTIVGTALFMHRK